ADALQAALYASREQGFWVGIGVGELRIPRFAGALGTVSTNDCIGDALEFSRLAVEAARTGAPARGIAVSAHNRAVADMASGLTRLLYRVCSDRTEAEWRVVDLLVPGVRGQQRAVAQALGITTQAVSRTLMRSLWHEEQAARPAVLDLLNRLDSASPTK
ncbi:MAG: recombinase RecJ, partial [Rothia dentocariosa]